jgi:hypothetical protein
MEVIKQCRDRLWCVHLAAAATPAAAGGNTRSRYHACLCSALASIQFSCHIMSAVTDDKQEQSRCHCSLLEGAAARKLRNMTHTHTCLDMVLASACSCVRRGNLNSVPG